MHNGGNLKLRIFIPQRRRIQPNFMNHTQQTTNQTNTTQTTKTTTSTWVLPLTQSLCSYYWDNANSGVFIFKFQPISRNSYSNNFVHFIHHQFVHFIDPEKPVHVLMKNFVHLIHPYMNPLPKLHCLIGLFLCLSGISFGRYCQKSVVKSQGFGKKIKRGDAHIGRNVYRKGGSTLL